MFTARRKEAYEALHPEAAHGGDRKSDQVANLATRSFADDQSAMTGQSARAIRRDAERGQQVCQEALGILKGTKADTGVVLDMLKDMEPEAQIEAATPLAFVIPSYGDEIAQCGRVNGCPDRQKAIDRDNSNEQIGVIRAKRRGKRLSSEERTDKHRRRKVPFPLGGPQIPPSVVQNLALRHCFPFQHRCR
ncbi:hypothetical protein [Paracoccus thiocyanatus]|uniref:hypothetical protein n=1 Tax=Paracoccus thiocyanatus TaxID=34006 RepID=UPI0011C07EB4|nr:hypothetical protein [Paracoccus thiocyanatus]